MTYRCPHCGNSRPSLIENNGCRVNSPDLTLLCIARVRHGDEATDPHHPAVEVDDDGLVLCGMQWEPNAQDEHDCSCCGTRHGAERDCRQADLDDCAPGWARSDRYEL